MKILKDKKIEILALDPITEEYTVVATPWAHFLGLSIQETFNAGADNGWSNVFFTIMKPKEYTVNTYSKINYGGREYDVVGIDLFEDRDGSNIRIQARTRYY